MQAYVYKTVNLINGKIYIGKHIGDPADDYLGSGVEITRAIEKHGVENFRKEVLRVFDTEREALDYEKTIVTQEFVARTDTYNRMTGGWGGTEDGEATRAQKSESQSVRWSDPAEKKRMAALMQGKKRTAAARANISAAQRKRLSDPAKHEKWLAALRKRYEDPDFRAEFAAKMSAVHTGRKRPTLTKRRMAAAQQARRAREPVSEETRAKLAAKQRARWARHRAAGVTNTNETIRRLAAGERIVDIARALNISPGQ